MKHIKRKYGTWAVITGASSGIGKASAELLAKQGVNIVLVARNLQRLEDAAKDIRQRFSVETKTIQADLTHPEAVQLMYDQTKDLDVGLVMPNAGMEVVGDFAYTDWETNQKLIQLNVVVPAQMANLFGRQMAERKRGAILFVSSMIGYQGTPLLANYAASKSYIITLGEALHVELKRHGVDVLVLSPGLTMTPMSASMDIDFRKLPMTSQKPQTVARLGLRLLGRRATVVSGYMNSFMVWSNRFVPRSWPVALFGVLLRRARKKYA